MMHDSRRSGVALAALGILLLAASVPLLRLKGWMFLGTALLFTAPLLLAVAIVRLVLPARRMPKGFPVPPPKDRAGKDGD